MCNTLLDPFKVFHSDKGGRSIWNGYSTKVDYGANDNNMARAAQVQADLNKKIETLSATDTSTNGNPVVTADRVLDKNSTTKTTIKSLRIPLNSGTTSSSGVGLNVGG